MLGRSLEDTTKAPISLRGYGLAEIKAKKVGFVPQSIDVSKTTKRFVPVFSKLVDIISRIQSIATKMTDSSAMRPLSFWEMPANVSYECHATLTPPKWNYSVENYT